MKNIFTKVSLALATVLALSSCGTPTSSTTSETQKDDSVLRIGMECNYAPFNWTTSKDGKFTQKINDVDYCDGYDVVMAEKLAEKLGKEVQIVKLDWSNLTLSLNNGKIDAIIAGMTNTPERAKEVDFTDPYYESEEVILVKADSKYASATSLSDFKNAKVQGQMNTMYDTIIDQINGVNHMPAAESFPAAIQALQSGATDGVTAELPVAKGVVEANPNLTMVRFEKGKGFDADTTVSIAVKKGNTELLNQLQNALSSIDTDTRNKMMEDAVSRQPAVK